MTEQDREAMRRAQTFETWWIEHGVGYLWGEDEYLLAKQAWHARDQEIATLNEMLAARDKRIAAADAYFPKAALEVVNAEEEIARVRQQAIEECANLADNWYARNIALAIRALAKEEDPQNE